MFDNGCWLLWKHISMYQRQSINILRNFMREHPKTQHWTGARTQRRLGRLSKNKGMATRSQLMTVLSWPLWRAGEEGFCPFFVSLSSPVHCLSLSFALDVQSVFFLLLILALNDVWHRSDEISVFLLLNKEFPTCIRLHIHLWTLPSKLSYYATSMSLKAETEQLWSVWARAKLLNAAPE